MCNKNVSFLLLKSKKKKHDHASNVRGKTFFLGGGGGVEILTCCTPKYPDIDQNYYENGEYLSQGNAYDHLSVFNIDVLKNTGSQLLIIDDRKRLPCTLI